MFKEINDFYVNVNQITKIEDIGVDEKDGKKYCRIFLNNEDPTGILVEGDLKSIVEYLNK